MGGKPFKGPGVGFGEAQLSITEPYPLVCGSWVTDDVLYNELQVLEWVVDLALVGALEVSCCCQPGWQCCQRSTAVLLPALSHS